MRLIDADALIEKLDEMQIDTAYLLDNEDVGIARARDVVESFPTASQWISVDERLPEGGTSVLAMTNEGDYVVVFYGVTDKHWHTDGVPCLPLTDDFIEAWCEITEPNFVSDEEISKKTSYC